MSEKYEKMKKINIFKVLLEGDVVFVKGHFYTLDDNDHLCVLGFRHPDDFDVFYDTRDFDSLKANVSLYKMDNSNIAEIIRLANDISEEEYIGIIAKLGLESDRKPRVGM